MTPISMSEKKKRHAIHYYSKLMIDRAKSIGKKRKARTKLRSLKKFLRKLKGI